MSSILVAAAFLGAGFYLRRQRRKDRSATANLLVDQQQLRGAASGTSDEPLSESQLTSLIRTRAKAELHCHLNGSVRKSTIQEHLPLVVNDSDGIVHTIEDAFREFKKVYKVVNSDAILRRIVRECLEDALSDNVRYLELRTTPRKLDDVPTKRDYVKIVIDEVSKFTHLNNQRPLTEFPCNTIAVRLILTIDRAQPVTAAEQTVDVALRFPDMVVGIDFAGNPTVGSFADFANVFNRARGHGLFTTVHTSEIRGVETETDAILEFKPNRVGHFLFPTEAQIPKLRENKIVIESCPTSNIGAMSGKSPVDGDLNGHSILDLFG